MEPDKRQLRQEKRAVKRAGNKKRRATLKRDLADHPDEAHHDEADYGRYSSQRLNGLDRPADGS